jgi:predicted ribosomally synthesized peptide with nif11-like leader
MSEEQLNSFLEKLKEDPSLQKKIQSANDNNDLLIAIAKEAGFALTAEDIDSMRITPLSESELEQLAGGKYTDCLFSGACAASGVSG